MKALVFLLMTGITLANHQNGIEMEVPVQKHTAVYENVIEQIPYEACWVEQVPVKENAKFNVGGAVVGGLLGNQVGKGNGKKAATILGALLASGVTNKKDTGYYTKEQRCETRYKQETKKVLTGYTHHVNILGTSYEKYYANKKDKLNIFLNIQFQDDLITSTVVSEPIRVVKVEPTYKRKHVKYVKPSRYPRSKRNRYKTTHISHR